jgi:hypothetical protein
VVLGVKKGRQQIYVRVFAAPVEYANVAPQENFYAPWVETLAPSLVHTVITEVTKRNDEM